MFNYFLDIFCVSQRRRNSLDGKSLRIVLQYLSCTEISTSIYRVNSAIIMFAVDFLITFIKSKCDVDDGHVCAATRQDNGTAECSTRAITLIYRTKFNRLRRLRSSNEFDDDNKKRNTKIRNHENVRPQTQSEVNRGTEQTGLTGGHRDMDCQLSFVLLTSDVAMRNSHCCEIEDPRVR